jgi:hypothetical protein
MVAAGSSSSAGAKTRLAMLLMQVPRLTPGCLWCCRTVLPRMGWPPAAQEQLVFHITQSDAKQLKDFLKAALQQLRSSNSPVR